LVDVNGTLFFVRDYRPAGSETVVSELWKTDGSPAGTVLVKEFQLASEQEVTRPSLLTNVDGTLFFRAYDDYNPSFGARLGLWKSDGTTAGTTELLDKAPGSGFSSKLAPEHLAELNGQAQ
jgi:ELWxxDGT repeat protein